MRVSGWLRTSWAAYSVVVYPKNKHQTFSEFYICLLECFPRKFIGQEKRNTREAKFAILVELFRLFCIHLCGTPTATMMEHDGSVFPQSEFPQHPLTIAPDPVVVTLTLQRQQSFCWPVVAHSRFAQCPAAAGGE